MHGLAADNVMSARVVLYNGTLVTSSPDSHADLFWALRGGGGGHFGVVTSFAIRAFPTAGNECPLSLSFFLLPS
jgi:FAD/FMN-containing dehydrogenase